MADDKTSRSLDRSQPHGQIFGDEDGRMWEQGGRYFNADGSPWRERGKAPSSSPAPVKAAADDQFAQQLKG